MPVYLLIALSADQVQYWTAVWWRIRQRCHQLRSSCTTSQTAAHQL